MAPPPYKPSDWVTTILPDDPAVGEPGGWAEYRRTGNEAYLGLTGDPVRWYLRPASTREREWALAAADRPTLCNLDFVRACLVAVDRPGPDGYVRTDCTVGRILDHGCQVLRDSVVEDALAPRERLMRSGAIALLADAAMRATDGGADLPSGSGSRSAPAGGAPVSTASTAPSASKPG